MTKYEPANPDGPDVFAVHRIDEQLAKAMDRKVWLPSGGTLVIDRTEAMTVVDVNTGKFTGSGGNLEQTVTRNNLEAAEEVVRQLRLRDIGGIIVIDFIDMVLESNRDLVLRRLTEALSRDRTRHQVSEVTSLGLVQLTRKKLGTGLIEAFSTTCTHCAGRGIHLHADPVDSVAPSGGGRKSDPAVVAAAAGAVSAARRPRPTRRPTSRWPRCRQHAAGEHPMFKAMAARDEYDDEQTDETSDVDGEDLTAAEGTQPEAVEAVEVDDVEDELDQDVESEEDSDEDDEFDEDDIDDDIDDEDSDDEDSDDEDEIDVLDDEDDEFDDSDEDDSDDDDEGYRPVAVAPVRRPRRRAAARPAGPPAGED
jgi:ribonuclease E